MKKLWVAVRKEYFKDMIEGKVFHYRETSTAREDLLILKTLYSENDFWFIGIEVPEGE